MKKKKRKKGKERRTTKKISRGGWNGRRVQGKKGVGWKGRKRGGVILVYRPVLSKMNGMRSKIDNVYIFGGAICPEGDETFVGVQKWV